MAGMVGMVAIRGMEHRSLKQSIFPLIPRETSQAALAAYGKSNFYLEIGDLLNGARAWSPAAGAGFNFSRQQFMLCLITIFQYVETLPDHLVPIALHERLDWKYALHLPLNYSNLDAHSLCQLRQELASNPLAMQYFQALVEWLSKNIPSTPFQNLAASRVIDRVCLFSRAARIWEAINQALEALAIRQPEWLLDNSLPYWYARYDPICPSFNLSAGEQDLQAAVRKFRLDGHYLLNAIQNSGNSALLEIPEVCQLEEIWREQFQEEAGQTGLHRRACAGCKSLNSKSIPKQKSNQS